METGFYIVLHDSEWKVAQYDFGQWYLCGVARPIDVSELTEIKQDKVKLPTE